MLRSSIIKRRTWRPWHDRPEATIRDDVAEDRVTVGCFQDHARCSCSSPGGSSGGVAWLGLWAASTRGVGVAAPFVSLVQNCSRAVPRRLTPICVPHTLLCAGPPPHSISLPSPLLPPKPIFPLCPRPPLPIPALPLRAPANPSHQENDLGALVPPKSWGCNQIGISWKKKTQVGNASQHRLEYRMSFLDREKVTNEFSLNIQKFN